MREGGKFIAPLLNRTPYSEVEKPWRGACAHQIATLWHNHNRPISTRQFNMTIELALSEEMVVVTMDMFNQDAFPGGVIGGHEGIAKVGLLVNEAEACLVQFMSRHHGYQYSIFTASVWLASVCPMRW